MKIISTQEHYQFNKTIGLSEDITLPYNEEVDVSDKDAKVLLKYDGVKTVKYAKSEVLIVKAIEAIQELPLEVIEPLS